jgi:hypothetical protein
MVASLAMRSLALLALALFAAWYALLGGRAALEEAVPETSALVPPGIVPGPVDLAADPLGWLAALAMLFVAVVFLAAVQRSRRNWQHAAPRIRSLAEERLWAEHLAWLEERKGTQTHALVWPRRLVRAG